MTKKYMKWWNDEGMINCAWMLCHGNWKYILWNKDLGDKSEALKYGCMSEEYLSDYGNLVFSNYFDTNIERVKTNSVYINRNEKNEEDGKEENKDENKNDDSKVDNAITNENKIPNKDEQNDVKIIKAEELEDNTKTEKKLPKTGEKKDSILIPILIGLLVAGTGCIIFKIKLSKVNY